MNVAALSEIATAYDQVGVYDQDAVNGFSEQTLTTMLDIVNPGQASNILDAMAGNGNLTLRLYDYCERRGLFPPDVVVLEFSHVQCEFAKAQLADAPAKVVWGDILTMEDLEIEAPVPKDFFDRVMIKSGNHEIPLAQQLDLYKQVFQVLKPGGMFINLGFLFDDVEERDQFREFARCKDSLRVCIVLRKIAIFLPETNCIHGCNRQGLSMSNARCMSHISSALLCSLRHISLSTNGNIYMQNFKRSRRSL
jgi:SAM-dependent methyltransferase